MSVRSFLDNRKLQLASLGVTALVALSYVNISAVIKDTPSERFSHLNIDKELAIALQSAPSGAAVTAINVEVDYMVTGGHSHALQQAEIDAIVSMFACQGITMTIDQSNAITEITPLTSSGVGVFNNAGPTGFLKLKNENFDHAGQPGWHYCIMGHQYDPGGGITTSSGLAEIFGDDFIVTLGAFSGNTGTPFDRAGTFVHELGHNLGLTHAGDQNEGVVTQYKPNYPSLMAYRYQLSGVRHELICENTADSCIPHRNLDYSHGLMPNLDENSLDERIGVGFGPTDWNCNGVIDTLPVASDLFGFPCSSPGSKEVIRDYDDWSNITDVTFSANRLALSNREAVGCITLEEAESVSLKRAAVDCFSDPDPQVEPCSYPYVDDDGDGVGNGCDNCDAIANPFQRDINGDLIGDVCPHAEIGVDTTIGQAPLDVQFSGSSDLVVTSWDWTYGDGAVNSGQNTSHQYTTPGFRDVTLLVSAPGESYMAIKGKFIRVLADTVAGSVLTVDPGTQVQFDVYVDNTQPLRRLVIPFSWAGSMNLSFSHATNTGLRSAIMPSFSEDSQNPFSKEALYSMTSGGDSTTYLQPGNGPVMSLFFDVPPGASGLNSITFDNLSIGVVSFLADDLTYAPYLVGGSLEVPSSCCFIPGDANFDFQANIADVTFLIARIFNSGPAPICADQADANGDNSVNIADVTYMISRIFGGGPAPVCGTTGS